MNFERWLRTWLTRHPLKEPTEAHRARYTAEVMAKITPTPTHAALGWRAQSVWGRLTFAAAAAAAALAVLVVTPHSSPHLAQEVTREAQVLSALDEDGLAPLNGDGPDVVADDVELAGPLLLAESAPSDEQWIEQTMHVLDQLDDGAPPDAPGNGASDEEWLDELQLLDESDHATSS